MGNTSDLYSSILVSEDDRTSITTSLQCASLSPDQLAAFALTTYGLLPAGLALMFWTFPEECPRLSFDLLNLVYAPLFGLNAS